MLFRSDRVLGRFARRLTHVGPEPKVGSQPLTPELFLELFPRFSAADDLRPVYDRETLDWVWSRLDFMYSAGPSEQHLVTSPSGEPLGWYIFQMTDTRVVRVSQIVALPNTIGPVLDHLLHRAAQHGAVAVSGRVTPRFLHAFTDRECVLRPRSTHTLIHARDPEILDAYTTGRAFLSLFESEGPLQIWVNSTLALERVGRENAVNSAADGIIVEQKQSRPVEHSRSFS